MFADTEFCTMVATGRDDSRMQNSAGGGPKVPAPHRRRLGYCGGHARQPAQTGLRARSVIAGGNLEDLGRPGIGPAVVLVAARGA